jgi:fatty-acyl-CoA synthase
MAASIADLILVNINPAYQIHELEFCLKSVGVKALVLENKFKTTNYIEMLNKLCPEIANCQPNNLESKLLP